MDIPFDPIDREISVSSIDRREVSCKDQCQCCEEFGRLMFSDELCLGCYNNIESCSEPARVEAALKYGEG